jgi:hypothetical protein
MRTLILSREGYEGLVLGNWMGGTRSIVLRRTINPLCVGGIDKGGESGLFMNNEMVIRVQRGLLTNKANEKTLFGGKTAVEYLGSWLSSVLLRIISTDGRR